MTIETKKYKFIIEVEAIPYRPDTVKHLFGEGAEYMPCYSEDIMARELVLEFAKTAVCAALEDKINFLSSQLHDGSSSVYSTHIDRLNETIKQFKEIEKSIKSMENIS